MNSNDFLQHYGVKGMKWGVRRYQNADGTLTDEGRARAVAVRRVRTAAKSKKDVDRIYNSLSEHQRKMFDGGDETNGTYLSIEQGEHVAKRFLAKDGDKTVGFMDYLGGFDNLHAAIAIDPEYQGKGYGTQLAKKGHDWAEKHPNEYGNIEWGAFQNSYASKRLAEKSGFKYNQKKSTKDWAVYNA